MTGLGAAAERGRGLPKGAWTPLADAPAMNAPQAMSVLLCAFVAGAAGWVARGHFLHATPSPAARRAGDAFGAFWVGLAATAGIGAVRIVLATLGWSTPASSMALGVITHLALAVEMWGLLSYLAYLFTGRNAWSWGIGALYATIAVVGISLVATSTAAPDVPTRWGYLSGASQSAPPLAGLVLAVAYLLPPIGGALAYASIIPRVSGAARYRVALVAWGLLTWFLTSIVLALPAATASDAAQIAGRVVTLGAILCVMAAYAPPSWVRRRYGIPPFAEGVRSPPDLRADERRARLAERARELI